MTDFNERLAKIEAQRQQNSAASAPVAAPSKWSDDPDVIDKETKRNLTSGIIGAVIGAAAVILGSILQVSFTDMQDWDWAGIAVPTGSKLGAFMLGTFLFCATGLMMRRAGWFATAAGFLVMLAAEPQLARSFPDLWVRMYQTDILGLGHGERVAELYVVDPENPREDALVDGWIGQEGATYLDLVMGNVEPPAGIPGPATSQEPTSAPAPQPAEAAEPAGKGW